MKWYKLWKSIILESPNSLYIMHVTNVGTNSLLYIPTNLFSITGTNTLKQTAESMNIFDVLTLVLIKQHLHINCNAKVYLVNYLIFFTINCHSKNHF